MRNGRPEILIHANAVLRVFDMGAKAFGNAMEKDKDYQISREAWIAGVFLVALAVNMNKDWYLSVNPQENSIIDSSGYCFNIEDPERTERWELPIQVFEWHNLSESSSLLEAYEKKLKNKDISNVALVCYANREGGKVNIVDLSEKLEKGGYKVREVWLIGNKQGFPRQKVAIRILPKPSGLAIEVDLDKNYQNTPSFIVPYRGKRKGPLFEPLGKEVLLKPDFEFVDL